VRKEADCVQVGLLRGGHELIHMPVAIAAQHARRGVEQPPSGNVQIDRCSISWWAAALASRHAHRFLSLLLHQ
jgi:hypothetical protein